MIKHLPNLVTLLNLLAGCIAIVAVFRSNLVVSSVWMGIALVLDFLDGMLARSLNAKSAIGKQLDSLADIVSFGVLPGMIMYYMILNSIDPESSDITILRFAPYLGFIIPMFSALRLAKFNIDEGQDSVFKGIPTPAAAILVGSLPLILQYSELQWSATLLNNAWFLLILTLFISILMVSDIPMMSLKFRNFNLRENFLRYLLILLAILLVILLKYIAIPIVIVLYILISIIFRKSIKT